MRAGPSPGCQQVGYNCRLVAPLFYLSSLTIDLYACSFPYNRAKCIVVSSARGIFLGVLPPARNPSHLYLHQEHRHNEPQIFISNVNMTSKIPNSIQSNTVAKCVFQ